MTPPHPPAYAPAPAPPQPPLPAAAQALPPRGESGWYPDPDGAKRFWDGNAWTTMVSRGDGSFGQAPLPGHEDTPTAVPSYVVTMPPARAAEPVFHGDTRGERFRRSARNLVGACVALGGPLGVVVVKLELLQQLR